MQTQQSDFVLSIVTESPVTVSIPHDGLAGDDLNAYFIARPASLKKREESLAAVVNDSNRGTMVASVVRGLLPRSLCDYNRPIHSRGREHAVADERLVTSHHHYHDTLRRLLAASYTKYGRAYLIDLHAFNAEKHEFYADIVLGSAGGSTTPCGLDLKAHEFFVRAGFNAVMAQPGEKFCGGYTVRTHATEQASALQIELSNCFLLPNALSERKRIAQAIREFLASLT